MASQQIHKLSIIRLLVFVWSAFYLLPIAGTIVYDLLINQAPHNLYPTIYDASFFIFITSWAFMEVIVSAKTL